MKTQMARLSTGLALALWMVGLFSSGSSAATISSISHLTLRKTQAYEALARQPLAFEANQGQATGEVKFLSRGVGYTLLLSPAEALLAFGQRVAQPRHEPDDLSSINPQTSSTTGPVLLRMQLVGANANARGVAMEAQLTKSNYFVGDDPAQWHTNVPRYDKIRFEAVYPGIDLVYYGNQQYLEYDFILTPGADPTNIQLEFDGADRAALDAQGNLILSLPLGELRVHKPLIYQEIKGIRHEISGGFAFQETNRVGFQVGAYDATLPLVIDPTLAFVKSFAGNDWDQAWDIAADPSGNIYITGQTTSTIFPTLNAFQPNHSSPACDPWNDTEGFVIKLNSDGEMLYSTFLGGNDFDFAFYITPDAEGNAYISGMTQSVNFPMQNAYQQFPGTVRDDGCATQAIGWGFVSKLSNTGNSLVYSTYFTEGGGPIAVDEDGHAYVMGRGSANFPTRNAFQEFTGTRGATLTKFSSTGDGVFFSTFLSRSGGDVGWDIALDPNGGDYIAGLATIPVSPSEPPYHGTFNDREQVFVAKVSGAGDSLMFYNYLGGSASERAMGIGLDSAGNIYLAGETQSSDFPAQNAYQTELKGPQDVFIMKMSPTGDSILYSTFFGGTQIETAADFGMLAVDPSGNAYIIGYTDSNPFPILDPLENSPLGVFIASFASDGSLSFSSGLPSVLPYGIAVDPSGAVYVTGEALRVAKIVFGNSTPENQPPSVDAGGPYAVNEGGTITVSASGTDPEAGVLTFAWDLDDNGTFEAPGQSVTFSAVGLTAPSALTIRVQVTDNGGLTATDEAAVSVIYSFSDFLGPVDPLPIENQVKAGAGVPVRFRLGGDKGLNIFIAGYPKSQEIACNSTAQVDGIEETVSTGASGLTYAPTADEYTYVWKTNKEWASAPSRCRQLVLKFNDGTTYRANFRFK